MSKKRAEAEDLDNIINLKKNEPAQVFGQHVAMHQETHDRIREVLHEFPHLLANDALISQVANLTVRIRKEAQNTIEAYLKIGTALIELEQVLDEQEDVLEAYFRGQLIPISKSHASKIVSVARDFNAGRFSKAAAPRTITVQDMPPIMVAYELRCLKDEQLRIAAERGLIAPTTTKSAVQNFRQEIVNNSVKDGTATKIKLHKELGKLNKEKASLETRLSVVKIRIEAIEEQLKNQEQQKYLEAAE